MVAEADRNLYLQRSSDARLRVALAGVGIVAGGFVAKQSDEAFDSSAIETNAVLVANGCSIHTRKLWAGETDVGSGLWKSSVRQLLST